MGEIEKMNKCITIQWLTPLNILLPPYGIIIPQNLGAFCDMNKQNIATTSSFSLGFYKGNLFTPTRNLEFVFPGPDSVGIFAISQSCSGVAARACGLVSLEPTKIVEILKDRTSWFQDCRNL
ncbi:putative class III homeodomain-leucine zipper family [Helianthus annuus]|nr:putative class III homeodomain-leucine zipper family [Helianthus annuus]